MAEGLSAVWTIREDGPGSRALRQLLDQAHARVAEAGDAGTLLRLAAQGADLIVLDGGLPGIGAEELRRRLRRDPATAGVAVVQLVEVDGQGEGGPVGGVDEWGTLVDAVREGLCLLAPEGSIRRCNRAMAERLGRPAGELVGHDFLALTRDWAPKGQIRPELLARACRRRATVEWPVGGRWLRITADPVPGPGGAAAALAVTVADASESQRLRAEAEEAEASARAGEERIRQLEHEIRLLGRFEPVAGGASSPSCAEPAPLSRLKPAVFCELLGAYEQLMELALEQRSYRVDHDLPGRLRDLAEQLGRLGAGPRDVVELHGTALRRKASGVPSPRARAFADECRLMALELMGHLAAGYRILALAQAQSGGGSAATPAEDTE